MITVRSETTSAVVALIVDLFGAEAVRDDNTYLLPSDTESADRLVLNVRARFDVALSVDEIRSSPTIATLAQLIERRAGSRDAPSAHGPDIITQFLRAATDRPNVLAVSAAGQVLSYSELKDRAIALMRRIRVAQGDRTSAVAILADRNCNLIIAVMAAAMSGSRCVVLSPSMWKRDLVEAAAGKIVLGESALASRLSGIQTVLIDEPPAEAVASDEEKIEFRCADAAFAVHSTDELVTCDVIANWAEALHEFSFPLDRVVQVSDSVSSEFLFEVLGVLARGGGLLIAPESTASPAESLVRALQTEVEAHDPVSLVLSASVANTLIAQSAGVFDGLSALLLLGVGFNQDTSVALASQLADKTVLVAIGGPDSPPAFIGRVRAADAGPLKAIGKPLAGMAMVVVDDSGSPQGHERVGELCVRTESGELVPTGVRGRVRFDEVWEIFVTDESQDSASSELERARLRSYWRERLAGIPACIDLPADRSRPPVQSYDGARFGLDVSQDAVAALDDLARRQNVTPFAVLISVFAAALHRYTGDDIVIGMQGAQASSARPELVSEFSSNTLVLRPSMVDCRNFAELVTRVSAEIGDAFAHDVPFDVLADELQVEYDAAHSPIFQVMFVYREGDHGDGAANDEGAAKFDLTLYVTRMPAGLHIVLEYATALFSEPTARRIGAHFLTMLRSAISNPDADLRSLDILPDEERHLVVDKWARGSAISGEWQPVDELIAAQIDRTPSAPAVVDGERALTYRELDDAANALASRLRAIGVESGSVVGVYLDRSVLTVVALFGILKAGGAYLPLDPGYPVDRLAFMIADSGAAIVVSRVALLAEAGALGATVIPIDAVRTTSTGALVPPANRDELAYLIYTSGSTGQPKGVKITHRNLATFLAAMDSTFGQDSPGTWLAVTSISFDISVLELLWTLTRGYRVVVRREELGMVGSQRGPAKETPASTSASDTVLPVGCPVEFSLFFFGNVPSEQGATAERYRMVFEAARFADEHGFKAIWTPERHFHAFGGLYPNPSVLAAALAAQTKRVAIRAGSVVLPLHDPLRVAEEWALVDNLSGGRVGVSFASGWQPDDFVLAPDRYPDRKQHMLSAIEEVQRLWKGERVRRRNGAGTEIEVAVYPRPIQKELPIWITSARHPETFRMAGEAGAGILTHLIGHSIEELAEKIAIYRDAWRKRGEPGDGHVTLMLHTFVGEDLESVKDTVRQPLKEYIRTSYDLMAGLGVARNVNMRDLPADELEDLLNRGFERFFATSGLLGTVRDVAETIEKLAAIGVDEVGCLIDFGVAERDALAALKHLAAAREEYLRKRSARAWAIETDESIAAQLERYDVTHLQCTPSLASVLVADPKTRRALRRLRRLLVGGEALPPELAATLTDTVAGTVHNMYGPTEATVWATSSQVVSGASPVIGRPLPGYLAYVVDASMRPVPIGVPGELLLGGTAVAAGYHGRPALTDEKFIADHLSGDTEGRLYRTGDVVRWQACGDIEFLGRIDHQVKLRGRRIELGEIEAALAALPSVKRAVCDIRGGGNAKRIVAYCLTVPGNQLPEAAELRKFLGRSLPDYMLPTDYVTVESFPLTPNGKIKRQALPDPDPSRAAGREFSAPAGEIEQTIAAVWQDVLHVEQVGRDGNFFNLGGNSVLVVAARSLLLDRLGGDISLVDMFRYPTVAALAGAIMRRRTPRQTQGGAATRAAEMAQRRRAASVRGRARLSATKEASEKEE